jgi:hypothetical protein
VHALESKFYERFSLCLLNPCLSFYTWANAHEVFLERELFISQGVLSGGVVARGCRRSRGLTDPGFGTFSCYFGFHGFFLPKHERERD